MGILVFPGSKSTSLVSAFKTIVDKCPRGENLRTLASFRACLAEEEVFLSVSDC